MAETMQATGRTTPFVSRHRGRDIDYAVDNAHMHPTEFDAVLLQDAQRMQAQARHVYRGIDLTIRHEVEISDEHDGNPWAWVQARIRAGNYDGINVADFIPLVVGDNTFEMQVAGVCTYLGYGDTPAMRSRHHIDFISREVAFRTPWNLRNYSNGLAGTPSPWVASNMFAFMNGLQTDVPNGTGADPETVEVDYRESGIWPQLPSEVRDVIVPKVQFMATRYSPGILLTEDNNAQWASAGHLWTPTEYEVTGASNLGSVLAGVGTPSHAVQGSVQYPIFANNMNRAKLRTTGAAVAWATSTVEGARANRISAINDTGVVVTRNADHDNTWFPICFRVA